MQAVTADNDAYLQWALFYARLGWSVVPVMPGEKHPCISWKQWQERLPTEDEIRAMWRDHPGAHVGIVTGAVSGLVVVDVDAAHGGEDTLDDISERHGALPDTVSCHTGGGGMHHFFRHPGTPVKTGRDVLGAGVDIRGDGGFVVAHPSTHYSGRRYEWDVDTHPDNTALADLPTWIVEACKATGASSDNVVSMKDYDRFGRMTDGREQFARDMVWAALQSHLRDGRDITVGGLFYDVWPVYSAKAKPRQQGATLEAEGRGERFIWDKCERAIEKAQSQGLTATAKPQVTDPPVEELGKPTPVDPFEPHEIEPRQWLLGTRLVLKYVSVIGSPPGVGKTAITTAAALAVAAGRDDVTGDRVWAKGGAWILNLEDDRDEMRRRIAAAMKQHDISWPEIEGRLYMDSGRDSPFVIAKQNKQNQVVEATPLHAAIVEHIIKLGIKLVIVDPYRRSYEGEENDNSVQDRLMALWTAVADAADCAIWLVHHTRKGGLGGDLDAFRGGGALGGGVRSAETAMPMSAEEAEKLLPGDQQDKRLQYLRIDSAKANLAPRAADARWVRLHSVALDNARGVYTNGDHVQAAAPWEPPSMWDQISKPQIVELLMQVNEALDAGDPFKPGARSSKRLDQHMERQLSIPGAAARQMIDAWEQAGLLEKKRVRDEFRKTVSAYHAPNPNSIMAD